jgi:hypothetical protein
MFKGELSRQERHGAGWQFSSSFGGVSDYPNWVTLLATTEIITNNRDTWARRAVIEIILVKRERDGLVILLV